jgi:RHS repeat-associated protein
LGWCQSRGRLIAVTNTVSGQVSRFYYDADGQRVKRVDPSGTTAYIGQHFEVQASAGISTSYYYFGSQRVVMRIRPSGSYSGTLYWIQGDQLGSASLTTNITGAVVSEQRYYPFGETRWVSGTMPTDRLFTGQRSESSGVGSLINMNAREYSPILGRFLSADSIVPRSGDPQSLNRYAYTRNSPLARTDPDGHVDIPHLSVSPYDQNFDGVDRFTLAVNIYAQVQTLSISQYDGSASRESFGVGGGNALHAITQLNEVYVNPGTVIEAKITKTTGERGFVDVVESDGSFYEIKPARWNDVNQTDFRTNQHDLSKQLTEYSGQAFNGLVLKPGDPKQQKTIDLAPYGAEGRVLVLNSFNQPGVIYYSVRGSVPERVDITKYITIPTLAKFLQEMWKRLSEPEREKLPPVKQPQPAWQ